MSYIPNKWCEYEFIYLYLYLDFILTNIMNFHVDELLFNSETLLMLIGFHSTLTHDLGLSITMLSILRNLYSFSYLIMIHSFFHLFIHIC